MIDGHFHVCEACCHIWFHETRTGMTKEESAAYHRCPECKSGPYRMGITTRRDAHEVARFYRNEGDDPLTDDAFVRAEPPKYVAGEYDLFVGDQIVSRMRLLLDLVGKITLRRIR